MTSGRTSNWCGEVVGGEVEVSVVRGPLSVEDGGRGGRRRRGGGRVAVGEVFEGDAVGGVGEELAGGGLAVAAGAADFLGVVLEGLGEVVVVDVADVFFVDAHAEGDGGDDDGVGRWT